MFRFFGFVWEAANTGAGTAVGRYIEQLQRAGSTWRCVLERPGLAVLCTGSTLPNRSYELAGSAGVVLGRLFAGSGDSESSVAPPSFGSQETARILATGGRHLLQHYWGRYVAFLHDADTRTTRVLRDPTGGLPCLGLDVGDGVEIYCSWLEDAARLGLPFSINWGYVAAYLCSLRLELNATGLNEVTQVLGGECVAHGGGRKTRTFYWNPLQIAEEDPLEDPARAVAALRRCTLDSVQAWASSYESIVHTLSGGLDSAIVLACLSAARAKPRIACINYHSAGAAGDERAFARRIVSYLGFELVERARDDAIDFEPLLHMPRAAVPTIYRYYLENSRQELQLAREHDATALFSGEGGDQLFYQARAAFGAGDYLVRHGLRHALGPEFFRIALDGARNDRLSVWHVLRTAVVDACLGRRWSLADEQGKFLKLMQPDVVEKVRGDPRWLHPLSLTQPKAPSGKRWHAFSVMFPALDYYDPLGMLEGVERVAPLFSQPVLETCLRIPVDVLTVGGWDRAIARRAFERDLPKEVVTRRGKGTPDDYVKRVLARNFKFVREMLLDGQLVQQGIVDRAKLETAVSRTPSRVAGAETEIYDYLNAEAWLQRFATRELVARSGTANV